MLVPSARQKETLSQRLSCGVGAALPASPPTPPRKEEGARFTLSDTEWSSEGLGIVTLLCDYWDKNPWVRPSPVNYRLRFGEEDWTVRLWPFVSSLASRRMGG